MGIVSNLGAVLTRVTTLRGDPACSFWVTTRMKGCRVPLSCCGMERPSPLWEERDQLSLCCQLVGWPILQTKSQGGFGGLTP